MKNQLFGLLVVFCFILIFYLFRGFMDFSNDLYLEKIRGHKALLWVKKQNARSLKALKSHSQFKELKNYQLNLLQAEDKLVYASLKGDGHVYNFWKDKKYERGLLRRMNLKNYLSGNFKWEEVLDIDALAEREKENWVYKGGEYHPEGQRVLFHFSRGGQDASVIREFDLVEKKFVKSGFYFLESRSVVSWISKDEIAIATDWKTKDSFTNSKYPRILKTIKRGDSISDAVTLFEAEKTDMGVFSLILPSKENGDRLIIYRTKDFFSREFFLRQENGKIVKMPLPLHAYIETFFQGRLVLELKKNWTWKKKNYTAGSLLIVNPNKLIKGELSAVRLLMQPTSEKVLSYAGASKNSIYIKILENVKSSMVELKPEGIFWKKRKIPLPSFSNVGLIGNDPRRTDVFFTATGFLESPKLYHYNDISGRLIKIQELPPRFKSEPYKVEQFFVESFDKIKIPYFVVSKKDLKRDGKNPTLLYAYGGFGGSFLPFYDPMMEFSWYRKGGVFVLANIRGGGEYGPGWHQAGLKEKRQTVFNDFYAVAEDLIQKKITSPQYLGIEGGSNGGLLMGVAITQRPELFNGALIGNPLLDMLRYHKLLVGSSWIAEYGDPENPEMRKVLRSYSPYQNLRLNKDYPEVFLFTSTADDRVHPGHARRFARKLEKLKKPFFYYENFEGGHSSSANYEQLATLEALKYVYLYKKLMD